MIHFLRHLVKLELNITHLGTFTCYCRNIDFYIKTLIIKILLKSIVDNYIKIT